MAKMYEKDLIALGDLMNYEQNSCKICQYYAEQLTDPESQELLNGLVRCHKTRFTALYDYLNKF